MDNKTELYYFDKNGEPTDDSEKAASVKIREIDKNGNIIKETTMLKTK